MKATEAQIVRAVLDYCFARGVFVWRNNSGAAKTERGGFVRFGSAGSPDILGCLPGGRLLAIECKTETGKLSQDQEQFLGHLRALGAVVVVARGINDIEACLREFA